ncbi:MAG: DNA primase, partial [Thermoleophilia bacterium]|nr:DNA primase [Thermoleophilia bacterium]
HCFGCSAHGDAIKWLTDQEGMEFLDAVRQLAEAAGMEMPAREERRDPRADGLHGLTERAASWFETQLRGLTGGEARAYLDRRGIDDALAREFGIGFAPDSRSRLRSDFKDAGDEQLIAAGLLANPDDGRDPYDRFRGRVIFPIHDGRGRPIAFSGRILGQGEPKYLNSPETALFDKGRTLFNLHRAAPAARKAGRLIAVEGPMDVIGLARVAIREVVAPQGTALTEAQIAAMWRIVPCPILCFDGDGAGRKASARAAIRALPGLEPGKTLSFVVMPAGQDPDDLARSGGAEAVEAMLARALPLADMLWAHEHDATPLTTPEARAALRERLVAHARTIQHGDLAREYEQEFRR